MGYFIELARADRFSRLILEIIAYSRHTNSGWRRPVWSWVRNYKIEPWFVRHGTASTARSGFRRFRSKLGGPPKSPNSSIPIKLNREFAAAVRPRIRSRTIDPKPANERELHKAKLTQNGMAQTLECLNRFGGAHGVDIRFPFWDKRLIEFCVRVPVDQKIRSGFSRLIMRNAMKDILPEKIRQRGGKTDMRPGFKYGLGAFGRKYCDDLIIGSDSPLAQYVDMDVLRSYYSRFRNSTAIEKEVLAIQRSVFLGLWLQKTTCR